LYADENLSDDERVLIMREKLREKRSSHQVNQNQLYNRNTRSLFLIFIVLVLGYFILNGLDDIDHVIFKLMD
jgi:hypothetical protein